MAETLRRELEASGPKDRLRQFTFNLFDVDLDLRDDTGCSCVLYADRSQTYPCPNSHAPQRTDMPLMVKRGTADVRAQRMALQ